MKKKIAVFFTIFILFIISNSEIKADNEALGRLGPTSGGNYMSGGHNEIVGFRIVVQGKKRANFITYNGFGRPSNYLNYMIISNDSYSKYEY